LVAAAGVLRAAEPPAESEADADKTAIEKAVASYVDAFNKGDAKALAAHWTGRGQFLTPSGKTLRGREQLEKEFAAYFAEAKNAKIELVGTSVEILSPSVAVERGSARVIVPEKEPSESRYEAIHVKTAEGWKIDSIREEEGPGPASSHYGQLQQLEWMIGQWVDADDAAVVDTTCRWTTNRNFLIRSFKVFIENRVDFEGTQVIGWDPAAQTIRSWVFDSDGGFGVGRWSGGDGRWTVQTLSVLPDGSRASATNIFELVDEDTVRFQSIGRQAGGELLPNIDPVVIRKSG
jgi:uncharacterized protein (TIGR02246 family)